MKYQILLVEYDLPTIDKIKETFSHPSFEFTFADEGEKAKKLLGEKKFDLMISAAMLPKFHGFNLSQHVAAAHPDTKIIIISGVYKGLDYKHQAVKQYKANDFFEKPLDMKQIRDKVFELLNIKEEDLKTDSGSATTQIPVADTKKIPTIKKIKYDESKLTSEDIFGDIIENVEKTPKGEINTSQAKSANSSEKNFSDIDNLLKGVASEKKDNSYKKIEDEISQKFADTLSGLGISQKKSSEKKEEKKEITAKQVAPEEPIKVKKESNREVVEHKDEIGGYDILGLIARGGMAEIYKAKKKGVKGFEKIIAIKKILSGYGEDDRYIEMFVDEAKIAAELSHPNIVQIYDLGKKDDYYFIAMEYVLGKDLREILRKLKEIEKQFSEELAIYLTLKVLTALNHAHSAKDNDGKNLDIVHRDISPPNILVSFNGEIKLTDFGVSKAANKIHQTIAGALKGKLLYMSPEQARGESDIDNRSDLYSVGVILFELITGEKLFMDSTEMGVLKKVQEGKILKASKYKKDISLELENIILKALNFDKKIRYQNASALIKDLESYILKNYNRMPDQSHIANFIYDLFKKEIVQEGIKIDLKPITHEIKRIETKPPIEKIKSEEKVPVKEEQIKQVAAEIPKDNSKISAEKIPDEKPEKVVIEKEEIFEKPIEINLDAAPRVIEPEKPKKIQQPLRQASVSFQRKEKKSKTGILVATFLIVALATGVYFIFFQKKPASEPEIKPTVINQPTTTEQKNFPPDTNEVKQNDTAKTEKEPNQKEESIIDSTAIIPPGYDKDGKVIGKSTKEEGLENKEPTQPKKTNQTTSKKPTTKPPENKPKDSKPKIKPTTTTPSKQTKQENMKPESQEPAKEITTEKTDETATLPVKKEPEKEDAVVQPKTKEPIKKEPVAPAIQEGQLLTLDMVDSKPIEISSPTPAIPRRELGPRSQDIIAQILIDHNGNIEKVHLIRKASRKKANEIIQQTLKKWRYRPAIKNNVKVKVWKTIRLQLKPNK